MNKQNLYVSLINAGIGALMTLVLKGDALIFVLLSIGLATILFIERKRIFEFVFRGNKWLAVFGYLAIVAGMGLLMYYATAPNRERTRILASVDQFLGHIRPAEYGQAYQALAQVSRNDYPEKDFIDDHEEAVVRVKEFRVDGVQKNEFDPKKAIVIVSSPFLIYGQPTLALPMVEEGDVWKVVFTPQLIQNKEAFVPLTAADKKKEKDNEKEKKKRGAITRFFKFLF